MKKTWAILLIIVIGLGIFLIKDYNIKSIINNELPLKPILTVKLSNEEGLIDLHFCPRENCSYYFVNELSKAKKEILCALYDINLKEVVSILNKKKEENVTLKIITDVDNTGHLIKHSPNFDYITNKGSQLMHNKFCVIDGKIVTTGSFNPTENDNYKNNNNFIILENSDIAEVYIDEFNELFNSSFGRGEKSKRNYFLINNTPVEVYFCPEDNCNGVLSEKIDQSKDNIKFMVFVLSESKITTSLLNAVKRNVSIEGIFEKKFLQNYSSFWDLNNSNLSNIYLQSDNNKYNMHHKVFILDNKIIIAGSYNPTSAGTYKNDENMIIIENEEIAKKFLDEFKYIKKFDNTV